jgi:hypothetical protein
MMEKYADTIEAAESPMLDEMLVTDELPSDGELIVVDEPPAEEKEFDLKTNRDLTKFLPYLEKYMTKKFPPHSGTTTAGCERGIAHCTNGDKMISQVIAGDTESVLDDKEVEKYRKQLRKMKKQLEKRHKEISDAYDADDAKYASNNNDSLTKQAELHKDMRQALIASHEQLKYALEHSKGLTRYDELKIALLPVLNGIAGILDSGVVQKLPLQRMSFEKVDMVNDADDKEDDLCELCEKNKAVPHRKLKMTGGNSVKACHSCAEKHLNMDKTSPHKVSADVSNDKVAGDCSCNVAIKKAADDNTCPTCKIKLWSTSEGVFECIACDEVFEKGITKEAGTPIIQLVVTPFERAIAGIIVNAVVANGRSIEEAYSELKKAYKLSDRDELSIQQLLLDMGYPTARNFMATPHSNIEFAVNYSA